MDLSRRRSHRRSSTAYARSGRRAFLRRPSVQILIVLAVAITVYIIAALDESARLPREISVDEAHRKYQQGEYFLDVRTQDEWNEYHVPNTTLIPLDQLSSRLAEIPRGREIVVVCRSGNRSQQGRDILLSAGFAQVASMTGGLSEWRGKGYPVTSGP